MRIVSNPARTASNAIHEPKAPAPTTAIRLPNIAQDLQQKRFSDAVRVNGKVSARCAFSPSVRAPVKERSRKVETGHDATDLQREYQPVLYVDDGEHGRYHVQQRHGKTGSGRAAKWPGWLLALGGKGYGKHRQVGNAIRDSVGVLQQLIGFLVSGAQAGQESNDKSGTANEHDGPDRSPVFRMQAGEPGWKQMIPASHQRQARAAIEAQDRLAKQCDHD